MPPLPTPPETHILPPNATPLERALSGSDARVLDAPDWLIRAAWDTDTCPAHLLPYLAQAWSVDEWDPAWSEAAKRQAIHDSIWIHQHKGTIGALRRAVEQLGLGARVVRWFERSPRGAPYTFRLYVGLDQVTEWREALARRLYRVAIRAKALRSYLDLIVLERDPPPAPVTVGAAVIARARMRIVLDPVTAIRVPRANVYVGACPVTRRRLRISPR